MNNKPRRKKATNGGEAISLKQENEKEKFPWFEERLGFDGVR